MSMPHRAPVPALHHVGVAGKLPWDSVHLVMVYVVLLFAVPSYATIGSLGSYGRPSFVWGLLMLGFWILSRLQIRSVDVASVSQPIRVAYVVLLVIALVSFAAAMLRGQPGDQVSPLISSLLRLLSLGGVLLVILDGVRTLRDLTRLMRFVAAGAALLGVLALLQNLTGQTLLDFWGSIPGITLGDGGVVERGGRTRAAATALHPLEFGTVLNGALPLCVAAALSGGFRGGRSWRTALMWWAASVLLALMALMSVSRSAIVGLAVAVALTIPMVPVKYRTWVILSGCVVVAGLIAVVPGLAGTTFGLFASSDGSTLSRTGALARLPEFVSASPLVGIGFGLFLPRYYIFDNGWAGLAIELGLLGVAAFALLIASAVWSAWRAANVDTRSELRLSGRALAASVITAAVVLSFFDGLSFAMSAGFLFVMIGLCAASRTVASADATWIDRGPTSAVEFGDNEDKDAMNYVSRPAITDFRRRH